MDSLLKRREKLVRMRDRLVDLYCKNGIDRAEFDARGDRYRTEIESVDSRLVSLQARMGHVEELS